MLDSMLSNGDLFELGVALAALISVGIALIAVKIYRKWEQK